MSLHEWVESRSREIHIKEKRKATEKGHPISAGSDSEVIEVAGQDREEQEVGEQALVKVAAKANPMVGEEVEGEVPFVRKRKKLTQLREMAPVREGTSGEEVVPTGEGGPPDENGRGVVEGATVKGELRTKEEGEGSRAELPLIIVPAKQLSQREPPAQVGQPDQARML